jgi:hypothetical protein
VVIIVTFLFDIRAKKKTAATTKPKATSVQSHYLRSSRYASFPRQKFEPGSPVMTVSFTTAYRA